MQVWQVRTIISVININWNGFHSLSNIFISCAKKNNFLANFGKFWQILANFGKHFFWQTLADTFFGKLKKKSNILPKFAKNNFLANFGKFWQILANSGKFWQILANSGKFWQILANSGKFWQILANSGKLWQTLANTFFGKLKKKVIFCQSMPKFALPSPPPPPPRLVFEQKRMLIKYITGC